jgi:hypothetical protein
MLSLSARLCLRGFIQLAKYSEPQRHIRNRMERPMKISFLFSLCTIELPPHPQIGEIRHCRVFSLLCPLDQQRHYG